MNTNDETIYQSQPVGTTSNANNNVENAQKGKHATWKPVSIGGFTGILMGAGAMYAANAYAHTNTPETPEHEGAEGGITEADVTTGVQEAEGHYDGMSFSDAFSAARSETGPGGVFRWHGNLYNTYTEAEWNAMSDADKEAFAQQVSPEISADDAYIAQADIQDVSTSYYDAVTNGNVHPTGDTGQQAEVHYVGSVEVEINGQPATVDQYYVDNHEAITVDIDQDGNPDVAIVDINDNGVTDAGEVMDLHTGEVISIEEPTATYATVEVADGSTPSATYQGSVELEGGGVAHLYEADGHPAFAIDVDGDGQVDVLGVDANGNGELDPGEAINAQTGEELDLSGMADQTGDMYTAGYDAPMDDFINDANIDGII